MSYESLVAEYLDFAPPHLVARAGVDFLLPEPKRDNTVLTITGVRRCGKTYRLYQFMQQLLDQGVPRDLIFFFTFDDDRLSPLEPNTASDVLDAYLKLVPEARNGFYLLLDEVQEAPGWERFVRRVSERLPVTIVLTGSSSKLLSRDLPTHLRGRSLTAEMWPLSFSEYCVFHNLDKAGRSGFWSSEDSQKLETAFANYLDCGGFPAIQGLDPLFRIQLLQAYQDEIVTKDVFERFDTASLRAVERFARSAMRSTGLAFSVNAQLKALRGAGISVSTASLYALLDDLEDAHLLFKVSTQSHSLKENPKASYKVYSVDPGLSLAVAPASHLDIGQRLETAVFVELKRRYGLNRAQTISTYSGKDCPEVDFVVGDVALDEQYQLIQVCTELSGDARDPQTEKRLKREVNNLDAAMRNTGLTEGTIITLTEENEFKTEHGTISVTPAWKWMLQA